MNQSVLCHLISIVAQQFIGSHRSFKQSTNNAVLALRWAENIDVKEIKTSMMDTEVLIIARPLTYLPSNSPEGVPLVLQQNLLARPELISVGRRRIQPSPIYMEDRMPNLGKSLE